jgi:hypothetical protein
MIVAKGISRIDELLDTALAANHANAQKAGRPSGTTDKATVELRDAIRAEQPRLVEEFRIIFHSPTDAARVAGLREAFDRGWGRPFQPVTGADGLGPVMPQVCTGVATPDQWGNWDEPLALAGPDSEAKSDGEDGDK